MVADIVRDDAASSADPPVAEADTTLYPTGMDASSFKTPERTSLESGRTVADNEVFNFTVIGKHRDDALSTYLFDVYVRNDSDHSLEFFGEGFSLDGDMVEFLCSFTAPPRSEGLYQISASTKETDSYGITDPQESVYTMHVTVPDDNRSTIADGTIRIDVTKLMDPG